MKKNYLIFMLLISVFVKQKRRTKKDASIATISSNERVPAQLGTKAILFPRVPPSNSAITMGSGLINTFATTFCCLFLRRITLLLRARFSPEPAYSGRIHRRRGARRRLDPHAPRRPVCFCFLETSVYGCTDSHMRECDKLFFICFLLSSCFRLLFPVACLRFDNPITKHCARVQCEILSTSARWTCACTFEQSGAVRFSRLFTRFFFLLFTHFGNWTPLQKGTMQTVGEL